MTSPFRTNPSLGPQLWQVVKNDAAWYDGPGRGAAGANQAMSPQTGDTAFGDDGREYMWVEASGAIVVGAAPGTEIIITVAGVGNDPRATAATGAGGWRAPTTVYYTGTIAAGDRFWAARTAP